MWVGSFIASKRMAVSLWPRCPDGLPHLPSHSLRFGDASQWRAVPGNPAYYRRIWQSGGAFRGLLKFLLCLLMICSQNYLHPFLENEEYQRAGFDNPAQQKFRETSSISGFQKLTVCHALQALCRAQ